MTVTIDIRAEVRIADAVAREKSWQELSVMELGRVRSWLRRSFNRTLADAGRDAIVTAAYRGQLKRPPYSMYSGGLSGVNGKTMREDGEMQR